MINLKSWNLEKFAEIIADNKTLIAIVAVLYFLPLLTTGETSPLRLSLFLLSLMFIFGILTLSFEIQLGRTALLNFGHAALFGIGAYIMTYHISYNSGNKVLEVNPNPEGIDVLFNALFSIVDLYFSLIPWPFAIFSAIFAGIILGTIMGLTTNRMKGTSFAFIALAIAMMLYSFFVENPGISGGETGFLIDPPELVRRVELYVVFALIVTPIILIIFILMVGIDIKGRREIFGIQLFGNPLEEVVRDPSIDGEMGTQVNPRVVFKSILFFIFILIVITLIIIAIPNIIGMFNVSRRFLYTIPIDYYIILSFTVLCYIFMKMLINSPFGRVLSAIAQNEDRVSALGYNVYVYKISALAISGGIAALSGALFAPLIGIIDPPSALGVDITIDVMIYSIVGGLGTLLGPFLGAALIVWATHSEFLLTILGLEAEVFLVIIGIIYVLIVLFFPHGIVGSIQLRSRQIIQHLQRIKIKESDYWLFALISLILALIILVNFQ